MQTKHEKELEEALKEKEQKISFLERKIEVLQNQSLRNSENLVRQQDQIRYLQKRCWEFSEHQCCPYCIFSDCEHFIGGYDREKIALSEVMSKKKGTKVSYGI